MDPLLEPFQLGPISLKNRILTTAHAPHGFTRDGTINDRYLRYQEEKAAGGIGLVMFGGSSHIGPDSPSFFDGINAGTPEVVAGYTELSRRVHRHGSRAIVQISHLGRRADDHNGWLPAIAPSAIRERAHRAFPKEMEDFDFQRVLDAYARAARYARDGGLDGIEIMAMSGHLPDTFLAPRANHRTDQYGGTLPNRARFLLELTEAIRAEVGRDFLVGIRMPGDESSAEGLHPEDCIEIARLLSNTDLYDFFNIVYGSGFTHRELGDQIPSSGTELGLHLPLAGAVRAAVKEPVLHAGRIADLATARYALREGYVDLVGMTRAHIADPHLVQKLMAGNETRIRPCVGASHCLSNTEMLCIHNPATGRESVIPQLIVPAQTAGQRVVIIGGGPAGLEAARVCAERGHAVTLYEAASELGGQVLPMTRLKRQSEKRSITEWLASEAKLAGARLLVNQYVDEDDILALDADVVIVATGGQPNQELPQGGGDLTMSLIDVLDRPAPNGKTIIVYDDHGAEDALVAAEHLATGAGNTIEIITVDEAIGHDVGHTILPGYKRRLSQAGVIVTPDTEVLGARKDNGRVTVTTRHMFTDDGSERTADMVVVDQGTLPLDDVYLALKPFARNNGAIDQEAFLKGLPQPTLDDAEGKFRLYRIGDALAYRGIHAAIYDARRLCMNL